MRIRKKPPEPVHIPGIHKGEEMVFEHGHEAGRGGKGSYRSARDSTSINPRSRQPISPAMPNIPPV
ncbi:MAG TPA: hypothetical protein VFC07_02785 [Verrucomicrobiae bacterium]|nr:hypothetical protein [Verrucomicrobiae bacterium]